MTQVILDHGVQGCFGTKLAPGSNSTKYESTQLCVGLDRLLNLHVLMKLADPRSSSLVRFFKQRRQLICTQQRKAVTSC